MKTKRTPSQPRRAAQIVFFTCAAALALYAFWATGHLVMAFQAQRRAHIFPTLVHGLGWGQPDNALTQNLSFLAPVGAFSTQNSAYLQLAASTSSPPTTMQSTEPAPSGDVGSLSHPTTTPIIDISAPSTTIGQTITLPPAVMVPAGTALPDASDTPAQSGAISPAPVSESTSTTSTVAHDAVQSGASSVSSTTTSVSILQAAALLMVGTSNDPSTRANASSASTSLPLPVLDASSSDFLPTPPASATSTSGLIERAMPLAQKSIRNAASFILSQIATVAYATTTTRADPATPLSTGTTTSTPVSVLPSITVPNPDPAQSDAPQVPDVPACSILGASCHTLTFGGFSADGALTGKPFKGVALNLSFGALVRDGGNGGKLSVRYFHAGGWHSAGDISISSVISNATNGGYFTENLDGLSSWKDLSDVQVVVEYVAGDGRDAVSVYLDSIWLDAIYTDKIQDVLSGHVANPSDAPDNVTFTLANGDTPQASLILSDGSKITFPYLDSLRDTLMVRTDRASYGPAGTSTTVFTSITNSGSSADTFSLVASFPGADGTIRDISQYLQDVPSASSSVQTGDVTYYCDSLWQQSTSTSKYSCPPTGETYACESLNDSSTNCLVPDVSITTSTSTQYVSAWVPMAIAKASKDAQVQRGLPPGYTPTTATAKSFQILPGQTLYFKVTLDTPDSQARRFVLSASGSHSFGDADSLHLETETYLTALSNTKKLVTRDDINDQLSEQTDFGVDQLPSFQFKFKTQRTLFARLANWLLGRADKYIVQSAQLHHASGEHEHLPVDIEYGANNVWTLQLERQARDFRPGRYSVDLTMDEGGTAYSDSVPFYWGVLALNPDKSSYEPNTAAHLTIAALDDNGDTMCNAQLSLTVTDPSGVSSDIPVVSGGGCGQNNITTQPDFISDYTVGGEGTYTLTLSRLDETGAVVTSISDSIIVKASAPYVIAREGPTRIFPASGYVMQLAVSAPNGFTGKLVETIPEGFTIGEARGATLSHADGVIYLTWDFALNSADIKTVSYTFKAPEVSPYMYLVGPATLEDETGVVFSEPRTWKIASDAVSIATGVAWLASNQTTNGVNINTASPFPLTWNVSNEYDTTYYSYSTSTNPSWLTVKVAGDYLVAVDVPTERGDNNTTSTELQCEIDVNGGKRNIGVGRSLGKGRYFWDSSCHLYVLLRNLSAGDHIESSVYNLTTDTIDSIAIGTQASMYVEYIGTDQSAYFGLATTTASLSNPGNLNPAATSTLTWYDDATYGRSDAAYSHSNTAAPGTISLVSAGSYMVFVNIPNDATTTNVSPRATVMLGGTTVTGGVFRQGYIDNTTGATDASLQWSGVVIATTSNDALTVSVSQDATAGTSTVLNDEASIYIQQLPSTGVYFVTATTTAGGTNWAPAAASNVLWTTDKIRDTSIFGHSTTTNSFNVVAGPAGDYLLALNDSHNAATIRFNEITGVFVGGVAQVGAEARSHFIRNTGGHNFSSGSLVYLLRDLAASSTITVTTIGDPKSGGSTVTEDQQALLMLWHKSAQSNWTQDTQWWYQNTNAQTPTTPWTGAVQGSAISTGNSVGSGNAIRLRMGLTAQVNTLAGADSFKLQYAPGSICSLALAWADVGASGSGTIWRAHTNNLVTPGSTLATLLLTTSSTTETYEESNPSAVTPRAASSATDGEWDWSLEDNGAPTGTNYCFRMVQSSGQALKDYLDYPLLVTNATPDVPTLSAPFDNQKTASTSPLLDFSSSDDNGDDINYEVQVSTDPGFNTTIIDDNSLTNYAKFANTANPSDKAPFKSGQPIEYTPTATLASSTTYWWRVRAIDPNGSNTNSSYSTAKSFTVNTTVVYTTWFQTTAAQFSRDTLSQTATTTNESVTLLGANTTGSLYSQEIDYSNVTNGNEWGSLSWSDNHATSTNILYHIEYLSPTSVWTIIPDADLPGNAAGTTTQPFKLSGLDPGTYSAIRVRADYTLTSGTPTIYDWTVTWALGNVQPTLIKLFDNEKTSTTTPIFQFVSTNPFGNSLRYQIQWTTDATFATGLVTRTSPSTGFSDIASSTASDPFPTGDTIQYAMQASDNLASSTTYWWRVRVQDPSGSGVYSLWSTPKSFTTDTTVAQSTWFQTTNEQFNGDTLSRTGASGGDVTATSTTGTIAIYRVATAAEPITTTVFNNGWDTTVRQDSVFALSGTTSIQLQKGHYAVMYNDEFVSPAAATNREEVQSNLNLAGTSLAAGWSQGIVRDALGANEAFTVGGAIINVANTNDKLILQSFRTDTNTTMAMNRVGNTSGLQLIKLDDAWSYIRLSRQTKQSGPVSTKSWIKVAYDRVDEKSGSAFTFSSGGSGVTLVSPGHYLVFANTYGSIKTNTETGVTQAIYLDKELIPGSYTTVYMRGNGNADGDYQGAAAIGMIVQSTTTNQVLTVQLIRNIGTAAWTIDADNVSAYVNRTGLTIVKLPEADFIQLQESAHDNINPAALTAISWSTETEKNTVSFARSTSTNPARITANFAGDYLFLGALFAAPANVANIEFNAGLRKNGVGTLSTYGQTGGFNSLTTSAVGNWAAAIFPSVVATDYFELMTQASGTTVTAVPATTTGLAIEGLRIGSLSEADTNVKTMTSPDILFSSGNGPKWSTFFSSSTIPTGTSLLLQLLYFNAASSSYALVPDTDLPGNAAGFAATTSVNISNLSRITYSDLEALATFTCVSGQCPVLHDWTVNWSQGINISGTAKAFDQSTNLTSGTVAVAVNGTLQSGKTGTIAGGAWTISNVTAFSGDVLTVFISGAIGTARAVAVTKYLTTGDITGMKLYQSHLTLGDAVDYPTITDVDIGKYDNSVSGNASIFDDSDSSNNLNVCATTLCYNARLLILSGTIFEPQSTGGISVTTPNIQIDGTFQPDGNTINISHSWKDNATFVPGASTVIFTATSTSETVDSSVATTSTAFNNVTFGSGASTAIWTFPSTLYASGTFSINNGTFSQGATPLFLSGNLSIGSSGLFGKGSATTTFTGTTTSVWTDSSGGQDLGNVLIGGTSKTVTLGSGVKATNITIATGDTLDVTTSNYGITDTGNWTNNSSFLSRSGTVTFTATSTGFTISPGSSNFYNLTFNGSGGNWAFSTSTVGVNNNFTITTGTVTLATGTTTVGGSFDGSGGLFSHNNGTLLLTSAGASTVRAGASSLFNLTFTGSGSWSFLDANATTSRNLTITTGTVTMPSGALAVGGSFANAGGTFTHNSGTLLFTAGSPQTIKLNGSSAFNMTFSGIGGSWSLADTNDTALGSVAFQTGTVTFPSATFSIGGSFTTTGGTFSSNGGTVSFIAAGSGNTIAPGASTFSGLLFNSASGSWTLIGNATSTNNTTITAASSLTFATSTSLAVLGTFTNSVGGSPTNWTNVTLFLNSGTSYSLDTKSNTGDTYATLIVGGSTNVRMWGSSAATTTVSSTGSLYSQNHAGVSGALNIWGAYTSSASENWAAATDFDGTALTSLARAVTVKIASSSVVTLSGTTNITGTSTATTTIANQGAGTYAMSVTGGTLSAQYYQFSNLSTSGLSLSGTPTVTSPSLANGLFTLSASGTAMTIASTVIDQNPALQIFNVGFATSSGVSSGTNVTESGTPTSTSYWWFRSSYGSIQGESFDNDPAPGGGNPGYIRWDNSGFNLTISGHVYSDHGSTAIGAGTCNGSNDISIVINGGATFTGSCNAGTGAYSISGVSFVGDVSMTAYLNTNGGTRAVTVTKTPTSNISNFDLYQNSLIVREEGLTPTSISDLAAYDSSKDTDVFFSASTSTNTMVVQPNTELYVAPGMTFVPAGNMTLQSGGSGDPRDGRLFLGTGSTFTAAGTQSHSIGGGFFADSGAVFTTASSTFTFTATTTGKYISSTSTALTFNALVFNGAGGQWDVTGEPSALTAGSLSATAGTLVGTSSITVSSGGVGGGGTVTMSGGTFQFNGTGTIGNGNPWQFASLTFGNGAATASSTDVSTATTTVTGVLTIAASDTLNAGSSPWVLSGGGTPFVTSGTFNVDAAPFSYTSSAATTITTATYANLVLAPAAAGSPTYTLQSGVSLNASNLTIGDGSHAVSVDGVANNPSIVTSGSVTIASSATLIAPSIGSFNVGGSWTSSGTFTHSSGTLVFNSGNTGNTISPGSSPFYNLQFNNASGGWTIAGNATSSNSTTVSAATSFTLSPNTSLAVTGVFTNAVGGGATTFATSTLYLNSGTSYSLDTKSSGGDTYGTLIVGNGTNIRMWNSSAATTSVSSSGSLYSMNHAAVSGALNIWGAYSRSSGSDYWDYATDFDGTALGGSPRAVAVAVAASSSLTFSGTALLDIVGVSSASTTISNQGVGTYSLAVSGGTLNAQYYQIRNTDSNGLNLSGTPVISSLASGDFQLGVAGGSMITVAGTVIDANPLAIFKFDRFATSTGVSSGFNVTETGSPGSSWKFNLHYGALAGEAYDSDPGGDPGYIRWDDSNSLISVSGNVYSDEGATVSGACDNSTLNVRLRIQGSTLYSAFCNSSTGAYTISGVSYNPGDVLTLYLASTSARRAANVTVSPISNISNMNLYENRVIVRHEDVIPITIANMSIYDSHGDPNIPFTTATTTPNTLTLAPNVKLIISAGKTFAPGGNVTLTSGGSGTSYDGTLEVQPSATLSESGTSTVAIGGSLTFDTGALLSAASSTFTFTATTTGKSIASGAQSFYNVVFNGFGGNWAFASSTATSTNNFTITTGTVTLPTGTLAVGGSLLNSGTFVHNNGTILLYSTVAGRSIQSNGSPFYNLTINGTGTWTFPEASSTVSSNFTIQAGTVTLPSSAFTVGSSFINSGTFISGVDTVKLTSNATGKSITAGSSSFYGLLFNGAGGAWTMTDSSSTVAGDFTISAGTTTLPATLNVGGSFVNSSAFTHASGTVTMAATTTGKLITAGVSSFYSLVLNGASGGWTITGNATTTGAFSLTSAASFTQTSGTSLAVLGTFTNGVGGAPTTWAGSTLFLNSGTGYSIDTKSAGGDTYGTLLVGASTKVRMWNSSAASTIVNSTGSLYSMNHAGASGALNIWGAYTSPGGDYWDYATDFDGTALGGSPRAVAVSVSSGSSITSSSGLLDIVGVASATTTVQNQGSGTYSFSISGGTLNASYYALRNTDTNGLNISGAPTISSLSNGDFQLAASGTMMKVTGTVIDANPSQTWSGVSFATSTGVAAGANVTFTGSSNSAWTFSAAVGNFAGEAYDNDGVTACGNIRWDDSVCLFVTESHYQWRNDDGGEGALASQWFNASWSKREQIVVSNPNSTSYTNYPLKIAITYAGSMRSDFGDLRFTDSSGTTSIPYYVEKTNPSASSTVWVSIASLPSSGSATIYMYYGNASATSSSSGASTFPFYEDFESNTLTAYSGTAGDKADFTTGTSFVHNGTYGLYASAANTGAKTSGGGIYRTASLLSTGQTLQYYQYVDATQLDEPCTLFGVQASGQNYALCLEEYPSMHLSLAKNVTSNDTSGTLLATSTVTYTTGWYLVVIDWLASPTHLINVNVYNTAGALFATATSSDSTYSSSGGMGFSFWAQNGGWDFYSARPYAATIPTYIFGTEQTNNGASWKAAQDTILSGSNGAPTLTNVRLRFNIQNTGPSLYGQLLRLQQAVLTPYLNCESVPHGNFSDVPTATAGCGSSAICLASSTQFTNNSPTSPSLSFPASMYFSAGSILQDPGNFSASESASTSIVNNDATEVEYNVQFTSNASGNAYCLRSSKAGSDFDSYSHVATAVVLHAPAISNISLNGGQNIVLTEGTTTTVAASSTVTDLNGFADIISGTTTIYRSDYAGGAACVATSSSCYQIPTSQCIFSNCSGTQCLMTCSASFTYYADPTDASSSDPGATWLATMAVQDSTGLRDTQTVGGSGVDLQTLRALQISTSGIDFGTHIPGTDTGSTNATTTILNTGNSPIDVQVSGNPLSNGVNTIAVGQQEYATSTFTYASCSLCQLLTGPAAPKSVGVSIPQPTSTTSPSTKNIYFGLGIPTGTSGSYSGSNTFTAVAPGG